MNAIDTQLELQWKVSSKDAKLINKLILVENELNWDHMIENSPEVIMEHINNYGWLILKTLGDFIWTIKLEKLEKDWITLFEKWGLIIRNEYREQGYAKLLQQNLHHFHDDNPIYSVTNVDAVKHMNSSIWNIEFSKSEIRNDILRIIEIPGKLLDDDVVFFNKKALELYDIEKNNNWIDLLWAIEERWWLKDWDSIFLNQAAIDLLNKNN